MRLKKHRLMRRKKNRVRNSPRAISPANQRRIRFPLFFLWGLFRRRRHLTLSSRANRTRKTKPKGSRKVDRLSHLSDDLLSRIVSELSTKESIRFTSLSKRWRDIWLSVPALDLDFRDFEDEYYLFDFIDKFLELSGDRDVKRFKLIYDANEHDHDAFVSRIDGVVKRRVCSLTILNRIDAEDELVRLPVSLYSCATLVNLTLYCVVFDAPRSKLISLPCVKTIHLEAVKFDGPTILETLISSCFVLEELTIVTQPEDELGEVVRVCSKSLKSFNLESLREELEGEESVDRDVEIDAPKLEYMSIRTYQCGSFIIKHIGVSAKVHLDLKLDVEYDDPSERTMMSEFLSAISTVRDMIISAPTLKFIRGYSEFEPLPQFSHLSHLEASFPKPSREFLPSLLDCCPNLQSLVLEYDSLSETDEMKFFKVPLCFQSSLEFVELKTPATIMETSTKMKLPIYFIRNCSVLKKLVVSEGSDNIIRKIKKIPKRSRRCEVVVAKQNYKAVAETYSLSSAMY
ncbi:unnamed protein product [Microthlaspi erraticum]|uniref:FBD domain-containing protein n=1 Tax=Microthlaspi erraticum TaxID=1685480 RepID=A0A6D2JVM1_9BRAS|nr:unnamed protein product [Microthlaspi erraticum]